MFTMTQNILEHNNIWSATLGLLEMKIPKASFETWLKDTFVLSSSNNVLTIGVSSLFVSEWLNKKMKFQIESAIKEVSSVKTNVVFTVAKKKQPPKKDLPDSKNDTTKKSSAKFEKSNYRFDNFVVGESNKLAYSSALSVASEPGGRFNPLFIYSGVGLGKTHLLQSIANLMRKNSQNILYVTTEQFTNEFVTAIQKRKTDEFRSKYRNADALILDDIQFLQGKEQTQEGLFHTFNDLHDSNKQIVLACDRHPQYVDFIHDRLLSRFQWGLVADIQSPEIETRAAIVLKKAEQANIPITEDVTSLLATLYTHSIRELEGNLNKLIAYSEFSGLNINLDLAKLALGLDAESYNLPILDVTAEDLLTIVAKHYKITVEKIQTKQSGRATEPQKVVMYLALEILKLKYQDVMPLCGNWTTKTIRASNNWVKNELSSNRDLSKRISSIKSIISPKLSYKLN
ncbi:MAG: chromosomal replication initiator protein DnaA [Chloroflexi bacterium]|nr:chromosomal replication initiator protein DnaA [Chloroflexota bacterium]